MTTARGAYGARASALGCRGALLLFACVPALVDCTSCVEHTAFGCYHDAGGYYNASGRVLDGYAYNPGDAEKGKMTHGVCMQVCNDRGYKYAGLEAGYQCFCGDTLNPDLTPLEGCKYPCEGDATQTCGGYWQMQVLNYTCSGVPDGKIMIFALLREYTCSFSRIMSRRRAHGSYCPLQK
jgi:hypothetical protein